MAAGEGDHVARVGETGEGQGGGRVGCPGTGGVGDRGVLGDSHEVAAQEKDPDLPSVPIEGDGTCPGALGRGWGSS